MEDAQMDNRIAMAKKMLIIEASALNILQDIRVSDDLDIPFANMFSQPVPMFLGYKRYFETSQHPKGFIGILHFPVYTC